MGIILIVLLIVSGYVVFRLVYEFLTSEDGGGIFVLDTFIKGCLFMLFVPIAIITIIYFAINYIFGF